MRKTLIGASMILAASLLLGSCGGGGGNSGSMSFVPFSGVAPTAPVPTPSLVNPTPPLVTPASYQVTGSLSGLKTGQSVTLLGNGQPIQVSQNGTFLAASALATGLAYTVTVSTQPRNQTCVVTDGTGVIGSSNVSNVSVACAIRPEFAYLADELSQRVSAFRLDAATGAATPVPGSPFSTLQDGFLPFLIKVAVNSSGTFAIVGAKGRIHVYRIDAASGALTSVAGSPLIVGGSPSSFVLNPAGTIAYIASSDDATVSAYRIDATSGALTTIAGSPFSVGTKPSSFEINPAGTIAYVTDSHNSTVSAYRIDATNGRLTAIAGNSLATGKSPVSIKIHPAGTWAYVWNNDRTISVYRIDAVTGALTAIPSNLSSIRVISINPAGTIAYLTGNTGDGAYSISAYSIDAGTGALTAIPAGIVVRQDYPSSLTFNSEGTFAYGLDSGGSYIRVFSVDSTTGVLTPTASSPIPPVYIRGAYVSLTIAQP